MHAQKQFPRLPLVERYIRACPDRYFVTLTTRRSLDPIAMSSEVSKVMHRANDKLFGTAYRRKGLVHLATLAVQELSFRDGLHTHLLVGVPEGACELKANPASRSPEQLITALWTKADPMCRKAVGQDAQQVYDFAGVSAYVHKTISNIAHFDGVDVLNTTIPEYPATVPQQAG